jgi:methyl-accepting chemotaxis protein
MALWRSLRLGQKLIAAFLILGLAPLLTVGVLATRSARSSLSDGAGHSLEEIAFNASDKLDRNLFERYGDVQAFAVSDAARSMDPNRITEWMNTMMRAYTPIYKLMVVADAKGQIVAVNTVNHNNAQIAAYSRGLVGRDVSNQKWFIEASSGRINDGSSLVEDLHHDELVATAYGGNNDADLTMSFTAPIKDINGKFIGVWSNRFNWDVARTVVSEVEYRAARAGAKSVRIGIASGDGTALALPTMAGVLQESLAGRKGFEGAARASTGYVEGHSLTGNTAAIEGWTRSFGYSSYQGKNWVVIATQDKSEALAKANSLQRAILLTGLVAALLITAGAWLVALSIASPLVALRNAADRISKGEDDNVDLDIRGKDEIADLADAFRRMVASVRFLRQRGKRRTDDDDDDFGVSAAS